MQYIWYIYIYNCSSFIFYIIPNRDPLVMVSTEVILNDSLVYLFTSTLIEGCVVKMVMS